MKRTYMAFLFLVIVLVLAACSSEEPTLSPEEMTKIRMTYRDATSWAPIMIANEEGYFAKHGIEIEYVPGIGSGEAIVLMGEGELDIHPTFLGIAMFNAMSQGARVALTANKGYIDPDGCSYLALLARTEAYESGEISSYADLEGKIFPNGVDGFHGFVLTELLAEAGLTLDDIIAQDIPTPARSEAIASGAADVLMSSEPWNTRMFDSGDAVQMIGYEEVYPNAAFGLLMFGETLLDENPEAGERFMMGYLEGVRQYNEGKTERNLEILSAATGDDVEFLERVCWPPVLDDGNIEISTVMAFQEWAVEEGLLEEVVSEDVFWDSRFIDYANENLD